MSDYGTLVTTMRTFHKTGATLPQAWRLEQLQTLKRLLFECQDELIEALEADLSKCMTEAKVTELAQLFAEIDYAAANLGSWMKPESVKSASWVNSFDSIQVRRDPLGVILIITPWNYPCMLTFLPLASALAAGNVVVLKPSEMSENVARVIADVIPRYFEPNVVSVVTGGVPETQALLDVRFDHISFTGSTAVGKVIMAAAAKYLTPVTLELGGKSPVIVDPTANVAAAARRIVWGRLINSGQSCIAPDYVLAHADVEAELVDAMQAAILEFYGENPAESPDFGRIINERHFDRILSLLDNPSGSDFDVVTGGPERADRESKYIPPTILRNVSPSAAVMQDEIFGPVLPVLSVNSLDEALDFIKDREKPLALYLFSTDKGVRERVLTETSSGSVCVNDTVIQHGVITLPFGGVGSSGMGAHHGKWGFDEFTHTKAVLGKGAGMEGLNAVRYPPYDDTKLGRVEWALGYPKSLTKSACSIM
ncbi:uncharacterized protein AMSG_11702 [Thecamonas trahens ATCC 50062]|uniref:Aldehyde dehydrogenase n=1 Tax=Thecamonas trahens ATCC 50062 TaxID=461836 RepID=A0A0L0DVH3_THETB|nr:hypothetical protein AMSG_11702 [Thecamonas trahens ATCC 50062]KNC56314.1 hypothetical protein AMSG_11702 [Thecamonas trahens ATCC 50062]|eukprot:XP_013760995.1 hypothetical protein AMSG_11702 [Thecamonas trahens ATCC 50062]